MGKRPKRIDGKFIRGGGCTKAGAALMKYIEELRTIVEMEAREALEDVSDEKKKFFVAGKHSVLERLEIWANWNL
jgi:hypothetical protein